jgi:hypothetical protein
MLIASPDGVFHVEQSPRPLLAGMTLGAAGPGAHGFRRGYVVRIGRVAGHWMPVEPAGGRA